MRNGSGTYSAPINSWNPQTAGVSATAADFGALLTDLATALTQSVSADGQTAVTGNIAMGGNKFTGLGAGTATGNSVRWEQLFSQGTEADIASATTTDIGGQNTNFLRVTGTTGITSFGTNYNGPRFLRFADALTLTHNSTTLVLPGGANITTAAGDIAIAWPKASGGTANGWQVVYQRVSGSSIAFVSVKDYGAVGDGSTNDTTAVQAALTACAGAAVYIPPGTYMVSGLTVPANTLVYGAGTASVLKLRATADVISTIGKHAVLQDFKIDGNGASFTGRGVVVDDGGTATVTNAWWRRFSNMEIVDTGSYCIEFTGASSGYLSEMIGGIYTRYNNTGASVKFPASETNGNRRMIGVMCFANPIADLGGCDNALILGCEGWPPIMGASTKKARVIGNRLVGSGGATIDGQQGIYALNAIGETTWTLSATLSGTTVTDNMFATPLTVTDSTPTGAANIIRLPRTVYTPTWTGTGSPAIGNGTLNGSYVLDGDVCHLSIQLTIGSTTTLGAGAWSFSLPKQASRQHAGSAYLEDVSGPAVYSATAYIQDLASTVRVTVSGTTGAYAGSATPFAWATGDKLIINVSFLVG